MINLKDTDNINCHLQNIGMGTLICKAAKQDGNSNTNEVNPEDCYSCVAGKIYRELGCDAILPQMRIMRHSGGNRILIQQLLCKTKKRYTDYKHCESCNLRAAETTKAILSTVTSLFSSNEFYSSYKDIEKARVSIRDGNFDTAITNSISSAESTMRIIHDKLNKSLPKSCTITELFKSTREILKLDDIDKEEVVLKLINVLNGLVTSFASLRNALSDAHGRGDSSLNVQEYIAELSLNISCTLSTFLVRRFIEIIKGVNNE